MRGFVLKIKYFSTFIALALLFGLSNQQALADDLMAKARGFLEQPNATIEQNQYYIAELNQFTAEGEFLANDLAEIFLIRAIIFSRLKDKNNAFESYSAAIISGNLSPTFIAEAFKNRGLLYYSLKDYNNAKTDFLKSLKIFSGNSLLHYYLANSYFGLLEFEQALNEYDLALEGMAQNRFLAYYGKASIYYQIDEIQKSRDLLKIILDTKSDFEPAIALLETITGQKEIVKQPIEKQKITIQEAINDKNKSLTPTEVYNLLLEQAFAAQNGKDGNKNIVIKLDISKENEKANIKVDKKLETKIPSTTTFQVSTTPFLITNDANPTRLDNLLTKKEVIKPTINPVKKSTTKISHKGFYLQLSSTRSKVNAQNYHKKMIKNHRLLLSNRPYIIRKYENNHGTIAYQLLLSGFNSYKQANSLCQLLKAQNSDCFVRQIK